MCNHSQETARNLKDQVPSKNDMCIISATPTLHDWFPINIYFFVGKRGIMPECRKIMIILESKKYYLLYKQESTAWCPHSLSYYKILKKMRLWSRMAELRRHCSHKYCNIAIQSLCHPSTCSPITELLEIILPFSNHQPF